MSAEPTVKPPPDLVQAAEAGDAKAQNDLGLWYDEHLRETPYAQMWFKRAADQGWKNAKHNLGVLALRSDDRPLASEWFKRAALAGDLHSLFYLGMLHKENGDIQKALTVLDQGARGGDIKSQEALCELILEQKIEDRYDLVHFLTERAAEQGRANAQRILGMLYAKGIGREPDSEKAIFWWLKAAENGDMAAQFNLGLSYHKGDMVTQDRLSAIRFLMAAATQGDDEAEAYMSRVEAELTDAERQQLHHELEKPGQAFPDLPQKSSPLADLAQAAEAGEAEAQNQLGQWYRENQPGTLHPHMWFTRAANQGLPSAMHNLGELAQRSGDRGLAIKWFSKAVAADWRNSFFPLGKLIEENGDMEGAYDIYDRGARRDCNDSRDALCELIVTRRIESHYHIARHLTEVAAEHGRPSARARLARMYQEGLGVEQNSETAFSWWLKAAKQGHPESQFIVGCHYNKGEFDEEQKEAAVDFLLASAVQGNEQARIYLRTIENQLTSYGRDRVQQLYATKH
jgi:TPR repeat protein